MLDKIKAIRYQLIENGAVWDLARYAAGSLDKLGVGCILVGLFQEKRIGLFLGSVFLLLGAVITVCDAIRKRK